MSNYRNRSLCVLAATTLFVFSGAAGNCARKPSAVDQAFSQAKTALSAKSVQAFDPSMTYVRQEMVNQPVNGARREVLYTISGPGNDVKSTVQYRIYDNSQDAASHANPDRAQQKAESAAGDLPGGRFRAYHSKLGGSALAREVPHTFHCVALMGRKEWSRCYYYPGGKSETVVVGTTSSSAPNEAILLTAMGAQGLPFKP